MSYRSGKTGIYLYISCITDIEDDHFTYSLQQTSLHSAAEFTD